MHGSFSYCVSMWLTLSFDHPIREKWHIEARVSGGYVDERSPHVIAKSVRSAATKWLPALLLVAAVTGCNSDSDSDEGPNLTRSTEQGPVKGVEQDNMFAFKGIPYAAPPIGNLRFAPPAAPADRGDTVLQADTFGAPCIQAQSTFGQSGTSEDCLYLNVYTPKTGSNHPVMVWIHGGAFVTGSGGASYNPERLIEQDVVVVTINYRLGALGFLAHESLRDPSTGGSGDYGIMDQQAALQWVQDNIAEFGGDPDNVTIFGESAGGHSVLTHVVSPQSAGLFHKAIVQSGSYAPQQLTQAAAETRGQNFVNAVGCGTAADVPACLRAIEDTEVFLTNASAITGASLTPNVRPGVLPKSIGKALTDGSFNWVPLMMGTNSDEYDLWAAYLLPAPGVTAASYSAYTNTYVAASPSDPTTIRDEYLTDAAAAFADNTADQQAAHAYASMATDVAFSCNMLLEARASSQLVPTYVYEFADRAAPTIIRDPETGEPRQGYIEPGAAHAFEIQYVLSSRETAEALFTDDQLALADAMVQYWTAFARNSDPNQGTGGAAAWPAFIADSSENMISLVAPTPQALTASAFDTTHKCSKYWTYLSLTPLAP